MWFFLALGSALGAGSADFLAKYTLQESRPSSVAMIRPLWSLVFLWPCLLLFSPPPSDPSTFWKFVLIGFPFDIAAVLLLHAALKMTPLSLSIPYLAFTPVFILLMEWALLSHVPSGLGLLGVFFVTSGAVILQTNQISLKTFFSPRLFLKEKGPILILLVSFLFSITSSLAKRAVDASSPFYFSTIYFSLMAIGLIPFQGRSPNRFKELFNRPRLYLSMGLLEAATITLQAFAFLHASAAYVVSIKRLSLLLSVVYGWRFFNEKHILARALGASCMLAGAILIAFA